MKNLPINGWRCRWGAWWQVTGFLTLLCSAMPALALECTAVFPAGMQSHSNNGHIDFGWNAQLLNNSSDHLHAASVNNNSGSSLPSCGQSECRAGNDPSALLSLDYEQASGGANVQIPHNQSRTLGLGQSGRFRNINVASEGTLRLVQRDDGYHISRINMAHAAQLELAPGDYWIENLNLPGSGRITVTGAGTARLFVKGKLKFPSQIRVNTSESGAAGDASRLLIYSEGNIQIAHGAQISALMYTPDKLQMEQAELHGSVAFAEANLNASAAIHYQPLALANSDLSSLCSQGPVTPPDPDEPPGDPGDGSCPAAWPNGLQTHAEDGSINFHYNARLHNASSSQLHSAQVNANAGSSQPACSEGDCVAGGAPVSGLELEDFKLTQATGVHSAPWMSNVSLGSDEHEFQRVELMALSSVSLAPRDEPYRIKELHLGYHTRLNLPAGDYWIENLSLESEAKIQVLGEGTVRLYVKNSRLYFPWQSSLNANTQNPEQLVLYAYGEVDFHTASQAYALIYARGRVALNYQAQVTGGITASHIDLGVDSQVTFDAGAVVNADYGEVCDDPGGDPDPDPDPDPVDTTPPQLQVNNPDGQTVFASTGLITGTVTDPEEPGSGLDGVVITSDQFDDVSFAATLLESAFEAEVPLAMGENRLTITATDVSGNTTEVTRLIHRQQQLQIINVTPESGAVLNNSNVDISGHIQGPETTDSVRFYINEWQVTPSATATPGLFRFELPNVPLHTGDNHFMLQATTTEQTARHNLTLSYESTGGGVTPPPELLLLSPLDGAMLSDTSFQVRGQVISHERTAHVTVNGDPVAPPASGLNSYYFNTQVSFPQGQTQMTVVIEAVDNRGKTAQLTPTFRLDSQAPQIMVHQLEPVPAVNEVVESPYLLSGTLVDDNLANFTVNGQPVSLTPGDQPQHYQFEVSVPIGALQELDLLLEARDISGNHTAANYTIRSTATAGIAPLLPGRGAELIARGEPITLQVAARISGVGVHSVRVEAADTLVDLNLSGTLASGELELPPVGGDQTLLYQALDEQEQVIASATRLVRVVDHEATPLKLLRHEPENNAGGVDANSAIELHFNKAVDPALLTVHIRETLHGKTYIDMDPPGKDFIDARGYELQQVSRSQVPVPGNLELLPGNNIAAFYPSRHYGFNANLLVDVLYDGEELGRFTFKVRPLPTFIIGGVSDQFGQPLNGVTVTLPGLGRETQTNADGSFSFGFLDQADRTLPGGRHRLMVNPGFGAPGYGTLTRTINLQEGRRNELGVMRLQELHPNLTFSLISSGQADVSLAGHNLQLDLSDARLLFDKGRSAGNAHVQFLPVEQITAEIAPNAWPHWVFATQPRGIRVEGEVGVTLQVPPLYGSYDYLLLETQYVVMVGYDSELESIQVMGLGHLNNRRVTSVGKLPLTSLDFIGYVMVHPELQPTLESMANSGQTSPQRLRVMLQP